MSLVKTLAKVAIGVALAKGASSMMKGGSRQAGGGGAGGLGDLLKNMAPDTAGRGTPYGGPQSRDNGLGDMMGDLLGGNRQGGGLGQGGLGGLLEQLGQAPGGGGGLADLVNGLTKGGGAAAGGLGGLLGGLTGAMAPAREDSGRSFGEVLNSQFDQTPEPELTPSREQEAAAALMLRAMIQATKVDGELDEAEKSRLIEQMGGDVDAQEARFVQEELNRPMDIDGLVNDTPNGMGPQVYAMSLLGIDLDNQNEAQYLHQLAQGFGLSADIVNSIHDQMGVPALYT